MFRLFVCMKVVVLDSDDKCPTSNQADDGPDAARSKAGGRAARLDYVEVHVNEKQQQQQQQQQPRPKQAAVYTQVIPSKARNKTATVNHADEQAPHPCSTTDDQRNSTTKAEIFIPTYENVQLRKTATVSTRTIV